MNQLDPHNPLPLTDDEREADQFDHETEILFSQDK